MSHSGARLVLVLPLCAHGGPIPLSSGFLYILHRGVAVHRGALVTKGSTWGEDIILHDYAPYLVRGHNARAMNYVEVFVIDLPSLTEAATGPSSRLDRRTWPILLLLFS